MLRPTATCYVSLEHEPPVEPGGSVVKVQLGKSVVLKPSQAAAKRSQYESFEIVTHAGCTVRELVRAKTLLWTLHCCLNSGASVKMTLS